MKLNEAVLTDIRNAVLCWLATVAPDGMPNVTPKEIFAPRGEDTLIIADIASANSVRNIRANPKVCVSFIDIFRQRGFKINGTASVIARNEEEFLQTATDLIVKAEPDFPIRNVIVVKIERIQRLWAPSYSLFPERSEQERMSAAFSLYGVQPL